jgi:AraC-like DNA-binding protein
MPKKLEELGISMTIVLRRAGIPMGLLQQERLLLNTEEFFAFWRSVNELSGDPLIGLKLGSEEPPERYDALSILVLHTRSLRDAVERMARYKQLTCPEKILILEKQQECSVQFLWLLAKENEPSILTDVCFARVVSFGRRGTGTAVKPIRVEFQRSATHRAKYEDHFGCPVKSNAKKDLLVFAQNDFDRPFVTHDPELVGMLEPHFDAELRKQIMQQTMRDRVKEMLKRLVVGQRPAMEDLARELNMSPRTLQRKLADEGSSFLQLLAEARRELAHEYLLHSSLDLTETAALLGFDDSNSFFRAFHRWEGVSPAKWRASMQHQNASAH